MCIPCMSIRPKFISLANENPDYLFIYIDLNNCERDNDKYINHIVASPTFDFYFNGKCMDQKIGI